MSRRMGLGAHLISHSLIKSAERNSKTDSHMKQTEMH